MYLHAKLRKIVLGVVLLAGALGGMPMKPEEIEELLQAHSQDQVVCVADAEDSGDYGSLNFERKYDSID